MAEETAYGKIIVLTGAGASRCLGFPTMAEFPALFTSAGGVLKELTDGMQWKEREEDLEYIYDRLELYIEAGRCAAEDGDTNLQEAFGGSASTSAAKLRDRAKDALSQLQEMIFVNLGKPAPAMWASLSEYSNVLKALRDISGRPLRVFTTNYDLTFESLPGLSGKALVNGIRPDHRCQDYEWTRDAYNAAMNETTQVVAYRLHGCSRWFASEHGKIMYLPHLPRVMDGLTPMVIFPARRKPDMVQTGPFAFAYSELRAAVKSANVCAVIGYSFRDAGVEDALLDARKLNKSMKFVIVDCRQDSGFFYRKMGQWLTVCIRRKFGDPKVDQCLRSVCKRLLSNEWEEIDKRPLLPGDRCENLCPAARGCNATSH